METEVQNGGIVLPEALHFKEFLSGRPWTRFAARKAGEGIKPGAKVPGSKAPIKIKARKAGERVAIHNTSIAMIPFVGRSASSQSAEGAK